MGVQYVMRAKDSVTSASYVWLLEALDFSGTGYPGPNAALNIMCASYYYDGAGTGAPPSLLSIESNFDGDRITLTFGDTLLNTEANWELPGSFALTGTSATVYAISKPSGATCELRLLGCIKQGETPLLSYTPGATPLAGAAASVAPFSTQAVDLTALDTTTLAHATLEWLLDADNVTVNGSDQVTAITDMSGKGRHGVVAVPSDGLKRVLIDGRYWLVFNYSLGATTFIEVSDAGMQALANGVSTPLTAIGSVQNTNIAQQYVCCWGASASTDALRFEFDGSRNASIKKRVTTTSNAVGTDNALDFDVDVKVWRASTVGLVRQRGADDGAGGLALTASSLTAAYFAFGALKASSTTVNGKFRVRKFAIYSGTVKTNGALAPLERYLARDAGIMRASLGRVAHPALLVTSHGQSNCEGRGTTNYARTQPAILRFAHSGHYNVADEPFSDPVNAVYIPSANTHVANGGWKVRFADLIQTALRSAGKDYDIILLEDAVGSTSIDGTGDGDNWNTNLSTLPRPVSKLGAIAQLRAAHILARGNCRILNTLNWQIEQNAQDGTEAAAINTGWSAYYANYDTQFSSFYVNPAVAHVACKGQSTAPNGGTGYGSWATARAAYDTLAAAYTKLRLVSALNTGPFTDGTNVHTNTGSSDAEGLRYVAAQSAAAVISEILPLV